MKLMGNDLPVSFSLGHSSESMHLSRTKKKEKKERKKKFTSLRQVERRQWCCFALIM